MTLPIVTYGHAVLKQPAAPVGEVTAGVRELVEAMLATMRAVGGLGLAAEQVGRTECICVIEVPPEAEDPDCVALNIAIPRPLVLIDPEILSAEGSLRQSEGCLSFPDLYIDITRASSVTFRYTDLEGTRRDATAHGLLARAVQHEIDHLRGVLLTDRMSGTQRLTNAGRLRRIRSLGSSQA